MSQNSLPEFIARTIGRAWTFQANAPAPATTAEELAQTATSAVEEEALAEGTADVGVVEVSQSLESSGVEVSQDLESSGEGETGGEEEGKSSRALVL